MVEDEKTGLARPYHSDLHLLDHDDYLAAVLPVFHLFLCQTIDMETWWEKIGLRLGLNVGHDNQDGVTGGDEEAHDPIVILKALGRSKKERPGYPVVVVLSVLSSSRLSAHTNSVCARPEEA